MSDSPDSLVLRFMRALDTQGDRMADDIRKVKGRVGALGHRYAGVSRRPHSLELRFARIEHRLDLIGEHPA